MEWGEMLYRVLLTSVLLAPLTNVSAGQEVLDIVNGSGSGLQVLVKPSRQGWPREPTKVPSGYKVTIELAALDAYDIRLRVEGGGGVIEDYGADDVDLLSLMRAGEQQSYTITFKHWATWRFRNGRASKEEHEDPEELQLRLEVEPGRAAIIFPQTVQYDPPRPPVRPKKR